MNSSTTVYSMSRKDIETRHFLEKRRRLAILRAVYTDENEILGGEKGWKTLRRYKSRKSLSKH